MIAYKVVLNYNGKLYPVSVWPFVHRLDKYDDDIIIYKKDKKVIPKYEFTKLFAFETYESAKWFIKGIFDGNKYELWKCEIELSDTEVVNWTMLYGQCFQSDSYRKPVSNFPIGTLLADSITLIERIQ